MSVKLNYSLFRFEIIVNDTPTENRFRMVWMANPFVEAMSTPPMTCYDYWIVEIIINLLRMPNVLIDYFLQDTFAIFLN